MSDTYATSPDGASIRYEVLGDGRPLVLVHGTAMSRTVWRPLGYVQRLQDRQLILLDLRGHGNSDKPTGQDDYAMDRLVDDVLAVLGATGTETVDYFGYSLGARVGLGVATRAPHRLRSLTLGGGSHRPQRGAQDRIIFPGFADVLLAHGIDGFLDAWAHHLGRPVTRQVGAVFRTMDPKALVALARRTDLEPGFADDALRAIDLPTELVVGEHDTERLTDSRAIAGLVPGAELTVLPGLDHGTALADVDTVASVLDRAAERAAT